MFMPAQEDCTVTAAFPDLISFNHAKKVFIASEHRLQVCLAAEVSLAPGEVVAEDEEGEGGVLGPEVGHRLQVERLVQELRQPELAELVVVCPPGARE